MYGSYKFSHGKASIWVLGWLGKLGVDNLIVLVGSFMKEVLSSDQDL